MAKITLNPIVGSYASVVALNARFQQIEDAFNDDVLWRDGFTGEPNSMAVDLDMSGQSILNAAIDVTNQFNADTLDFLDSTQFLRSDESDTITGTLTATGGFIGDVTGDLVGSVTGPTYVVNDNPPDTTMFPLIVGSNAVGHEDVSTDGSFKWDASNNELTVPTIVSDLTGSVFVPVNGLTINGVAVTATALEINRSIYFPDAAVNEIANVATRANKFLGFDALGEMTFTAGTATVSANAVSITDLGGYYTAIEVETALQDIATPSIVGKGANIIGYNDVGGFLSGADNVNDAIVTAALQISDLQDSNDRAVFASFGFDTGGPSAVDDTTLAHTITAGPLDINLGITIDNANFAYCLIVDSNGKTSNLMTNTSYSGAMVIPPTPVAGSFTVRVASNASGAWSGIFDVSVRKLIA